MLRSWACESESVIIIANIAPMVHEVKSDWVPIGKVTVREDIYQEKVRFLQFSISTVATVILESMHVSTGLLVAGS